MSGKGTLSRRNHGRTCQGERDCIVALSGGRNELRLCKARISEQGPVADDRERRGAVGAAFARDFPSGHPAAAFEDAGERELLGGFAEALAHPYARRSSSATVSARHSTTGSLGASRGRRGVSGRAAR